MNQGRQIAIFLPTLCIGGAERVSIYLANAFVSRGLDVELVLMQAEGELLPLLDPRVRVVDLGAARMRNLARPLARYLCEHRPAAVLANMWPLTIMAVAVACAVRAKARVVVVEHNNWSAQSKHEGFVLRQFRKLSMRLLLPFASARVGVSKGVAQDLETYAALAEGSVQCVYNPVTGSPRKQQPIQSSPDTDCWRAGKRLLSVGVLQTQKRFDWLLTAFSQVAAENPEARLLILGDGPERASLESMVSRLGLQGRVFLPGFVDGPAAYYAEADLFVLSSEYEGLSMVLVEALEQGTPVVSMDCPSGPREVLEDGRHGALVPVGDVDALASAMQEALGAHHDHEALKRRAQDFSVDKAADAYLDLLLPGWRALAAAEVPAVSQSQPMSPQ